MKNQNNIFVVIASGPSLTKEDVDWVKKFKNQVTTVCVNDNYKIAPWADHLYAADVQWWTKHLKNIEKTKFVGKKWIPIQKKFASENGLEYVECKYRKGLGKNKILHCGHNSGYQAINLCYNLGSDMIILLGYDMKTGKTKKDNHWFGQHPKGLRNEYNYQKWLSHYEDLAKDLRQAGVEVINCTRSTAITQFKRNIITEVLKENK